MNENDRLTETLKVSVMLEVNKRKAKRITAYLTMAEKAYKRFLEWNGKLMRYDIAERKVEGWTLTHSKIETAHIAERSWKIYKRCIEVYIRLVKSL